MEENNLALDVLRQQQEQHNEECDRLHTIIHRIIVALCIVTTLLVVLIGFMVWESYQTTEDTTKIEQQGENGQNNYIGNNGEINNGKTDNNKNN